MSVIKSSHNQFYWKQRRTDKRGPGGAGEAGGTGAGAANARKGAVIGAKEILGGSFPPIFQLVKWVSRLKWSVNGDLLAKTN